jgi:hypothetical protein
VRPSKVIVIMQGLGRKNRAFVLGAPGERPAPICQRQFSAPIHCAHGRDTSPVSEPLCWRAKCHYELILLIFALNRSRFPCNCFCSRLATLAGTRRSIGGAMAGWRGP